MKKNLTLIFSAFVLCINVQAQQTEQIIDHYQKQKNGLNVDYKVVETIEDQNLQRVYAQRTTQGIPVYNLYTTYLIKDNRIVSDQASRNFTIPLEKITIHPSFSLDEAVRKLGSHEGLSVKFTDKNDYSIQQGIYFIKEDTNHLVYYIDAFDKNHLAYSFTVRKVDRDGNNLFDVLIDAHSGEILEIHNQTLSCGFNHESFENENAHNFNKEDWQWLYNDISNITEPNAIYSVYTLPIESPNHGKRTSIGSTIAHPEASPLGWHNNGTESTSLTKGNNVNAVSDHQSIGYQTYNGYGATITDFTDGGTNMNFDFPIDLDKHPYKNKEASTTNLFYMNNMMHDIFYQYGFDEANGNFQKSNFGKSGQGNDAVIALAQTGLIIGNTNNATFGTPPDGNPPLMSMYLWDPPATYKNSALTILAPSNLAKEYSASLAAFGPNLPSTPFVSDLVLVKKSETTGTPYDGCGTISNLSEMNNKIAVVYRGECSFVVKVKAAQQAGAKAVIIVNNAVGDINMGGEDSTINIPTIALTKADGDPIIQTLQNSTPVKGSLKEIEVPYKDGSLDNGIIAHEYGHGISNRLTGPLSNSNCLRNGEQMGEGWSDFFGLMLTQLPGDSSETKRGIGTYAMNQPISGNGIRPTPYSTNMSVNPTTYGTLKTFSETESPHRTGYVWATMLWDLNWKLIEKYGFSPDLHDGTAGNNLAMQLVVSGLKLQPCSPGFVDGRDAILKADELLNNSENTCEIWDVFARRGLGLSASQGSANLRRDAVEAKDVPASCVLSTLETEKGSNLQLFPNPAKDIVHIVDKTMKGKVKVEIIDLTGRLVSNETISFNNDRTSISTQHLSSGVYILKLYSPNGVVTKKLIKK